MQEQKKSIYTAAILWTVVLTAVVGFKVVRAAWQAPACDPNVDGPAACNTPGPIWNARDAQFPAGGQDADLNIKGTGLFDNLTVRVQSLLQGPTNISGNLTVSALSTFTRDVAVQGARVTVNGNEVCHAGNNCNQGAGQVPTLQQVTDVGASTTRAITIDLNDAASAGLTIKTPAGIGTYGVFVDSEDAATKPGYFVNRTNRADAFLGHIANVGVFADIPLPMPTGVQGTGDFGVVGNGNHTGVAGRGANTGIAGYGPMGLWGQGVGDNNAATADRAVGLLASASGGNENYAARFTQGDVYAGEGLEVVGATTLRGNTTLNNIIIAAGRTIRGVAEFVNDVAVNGSTSLQALTVNGVAAFKRPVTITADPAVNALVVQSGKTSLIGATSIKGNTLVDGRLNVTQGCVGCADVAESVANSERVEAGDVVVLDLASPKKVRRSTKAYDRRVAGVVSSKPTLVMGDEKSGVPIALVGIVPVKVTSANGTIAVGDLLVSSNLPGRAMRATDADKAFGAVIGKAVEPSSASEGIIDVLVNLQ